MSAPFIGSFLCIHAYWKSNISGLSHAEPREPISSEVHGLPSAPTSCCHLVELGNGSIICYIFNGMEKNTKQKQLSLTVSYHKPSVQSSVLSMCYTAKFPKSICSSYCENNELVCVMQGLSYPCQMALSSGWALPIAQVHAASAAPGSWNYSIQEELLPSHHRNKALILRSCQPHWLTY